MQNKTLFMIWLESENKDSKATFSMNMLVINRFAPFFKKNIAILDLTRFFLLLSILLMVFGSGQSVCADTLLAQAAASKPAPLRPLDRDPCVYPILYYCTEPLKVNIGKYWLDIPRNYIGQAPPGNHFIELLFRWPGMQGREKYRKNSKQSVFNLIHILIHTE